MGSKVLTKAFAIFNAFLVTNSDSLIWFWMLFSRPKVKLHWSLCTARSTYDCESDQKIRIQDSKTWVQKFRSKVWYRSWWFVGLQILWQSSGLQVVQTSPVCSIAIPSLPHFHWTLKGLELFLSSQGSIYIIVGLPHSTLIRLENCSCCDSLHSDLTAWNYTLSLKHLKLTSKLPS